MNAERIKVLVKDAIIENPFNTNMAAAAALDAIPNNWVKIDNEWIEITSDGVGYGEFDRKTP